MKPICPECGAEFQNAYDACPHQEARTQATFRAGQMAMARRLVVMEECLRSLTPPPLLVPNNSPKRRKRRTPGSSHADD